MMEGVRADLKALGIAFDRFVSESALVASGAVDEVLKDLEKKGLISRRSFRRHPPRVEYRLTRKGAAFSGVVEAMRAYGKKYL